MGGVSDRDFVTETLQWVGMLMQHISRWAGLCPAGRRLLYRQLPHAAKEEPRQPRAFEQMKEIDERFEEDIAEVFDYETSVERRSVEGGTRKSSVLEQRLCSRRC